MVVLKRLRAPEGCPWDRKQTEKTMAPLLLEEAYEAVEAIGSGQDEKAAEELEDKEILGRDVFPRPGSEANGGGELTVNLFDLIEALKGILEKVDAQDAILDFTKEKISLKDKMMEIIEKLEAVEYLVFQDLFSSAENRYEIILTFIALLELIRNQKVRILQLEVFGTIRISLRDG